MYILHMEKVFTIKNIIVAIVSPCEISDLNEHYLVVLFTYYCNHNYTCKFIYIHYSSLYML